MWILFLENIGKGSQKINGVMRKKKNKRVIALLFLSLAPSLFLSIYLYLSLSLTISLSALYISHYLSLSLSLKVILKITGPQSLIHIGGDRGGIKTIDLMVHKDIANILGGGLYASHIELIPMGILCLFFSVLQRGHSHVGCGKCWCPCNCRSFEVGCLGL